VIDTFAFSFFKNVFGYFVAFRDLDKLKEGIGEKVVIVIFLIMTFVIGIVSAFVYGWKLTLVVLSCVPFIIAATSVVARLQGSLAEKELKSYSDAANVAEEVFSGIRTVFAFSGQEKENARFGKLLIPAENTGLKRVSTQAWETPSLGWLSTSAMPWPSGME